MKKTTKKVMAGLMAAAMAVSLSACGGGDSKEATTAAAGVQAAEAGSLQGKSIKVLAPEEPGSEDALNNAIDKWAAEEGVKVERIIISHDDQLTKFPAMAKNKDLPDLIQTTRLHQLYPEEFVDMSTVVDLDLFEESALKIVGKDYKSDKISGLPSQFTTTNMYYN
ncbi:MAG: sugar ABC transporter substrate-binding protein, partial [Hungatella hathewayi]